MQGLSLDELYRQHVTTAATYLLDVHAGRSTLSGRQHAYLLAKAASARRAARFVKLTIRMVDRQYAARHNMA